MKSKLIISLCIIMILTFTLGFFYLNQNDNVKEQYPLLGQVSSGGVERTIANSLDIVTETDLINNYGGWTQNGSEVYFEDNRIYISAEDNTLIPIVSFNTKNYTGNVNIAFGFNTQQVKPTKAEYNKHYENVTLQFNCDYEFNYTVTPIKHFWCYKIHDFTNETEDYIEVLYQHDFDSGDLDNGIAYWNETREVWDDVSGAFDKTTFFIGDVDTWYYKKDFSVVANEVYDLKISLQPQYINTPKTKYWIAIYPSDRTIKEAIEDETFYMLDPWTAPLNDNLTAYYPFEEGTGSTTEDVTGGGFQLTASGGATFNLTDCIIGNCTELERDSSQYWAETTASGNFTYNNSWTINAWVNGESITAPSNVIALPNDDDAGTYRWGIRRVNGETGYQLLTHLTSGSLLASSPNTLSLETWYMLTYMRNATGGFIYVDGVQAGQDLDATGLAPMVELYKMSVGAIFRSNIFDQFYDGQIDEVGLWERELSTAEITQLYNGGAGITWTDTFPTVGINVTLIEPPSDVEESSNTTTKSYNISCNASSVDGVVNLSRIINGTLFDTVTNSTPLENLTIQGNITFPSAVNNWTCTGWTLTDMDTPTVRTINYTYRIIDVDLLAPPDNFLTNLTSFNFTANVTNISLGINNVSIVWDDVINQTNTSSFIGNYTFQMDDISEGNHEWYFQAFGLDGLKYRSETTRLYTISQINLTLINPVDAYNSSNTTVNFNCSASTTVEGIQNITLTIDGTDNLTVTNSTPNENLSIDVLRVLPEGSHNWSCKAFSMDDLTQSATRTMLLDNTRPIINISSPIDLFSTLVDGETLNLNWTLTEDNPAQCWHNYTGSPLTNCYQESANTTNQQSNDGSCSQVYNGSYEWQDNTGIWSDPQNMVDGEWSTFGIHTQALSTKRFFINYTIPFSYDSANWSWKFDRVGASASFYHCLNSTGSWIQFTDLDTGAGAFNSSLLVNSDCLTDDILQIRLSLRTNQRLYEEAINWQQNRTFFDCSLNTTTFNYVADVNSITMFANDTVGNVNSTTKTWTVLLIEDNVTFSPFDFETNRDTFSVNFTTTEQVLSITPFLNYNNTLFTTTSSCTSGVCFIETDIDIPLILGDVESENRSWFFQVEGFSANETFSFNTTTRQQNVSRIHLEECSTIYTTEYINFTAFDEQTLLDIKPFDFSSAISTWLGSGTVRRTNNFTNSSINEMEMCFSPSTENIRINGTVNYDQTSSTNYTQRNYFFDNDSFNNITTAIKLGLLLAEDSTSFILKVQDADILPLPDILIFTQRYYPGIDDYVTVAVSKTDDNGKTVGFFEVETVEYRFMLKQNGQILLITNKQKMVPEESPFTLTFTVGEDEGAAWAEYEELEELTKSFTFNRSSNVVTFTYIDTSSDFELMRLIVDKINSSGLTNIEVCDVNLSQSTGSLSCNVTSSGTGSYTARALVTRGGETTLVEQLLFMVESFSMVAGNLGLFLGWFIILISAFAFRFNEIAGIVLVNLAVIFNNMVGLIAFGPVFITSMIALSIIILVVLER